MGTDHYHEREMYFIVWETDYNQCLVNYSKIQGCCNFLNKKRKANLYSVEFWVLYFQSVFGLKTRWPWNKVSPSQPFCALVFFSENIRVVFSKKFNILRLLFNWWQLCRIKCIPVLAVTAIWEKYVTYISVVPLIGLRMSSFSLNTKIQTFWLISNNFVGTPFFTKCLGMGTPYFLKALNKF